MSEIYSADSPVEKGRRETPCKYLCLRFRVDVDAEDRFTEEMGSLSTMGIEQQELSTDEASYLVYFRLPLEPAVGDLASEARRIAGAELVETRQLADQDWLALYRERLQPFALGRNWWVDPREPGSPEVRSPSGRRLLRIPAWTAFGTGTHVSTALLVRLLENLPLRSKRVLDLGTGTGILAMVALELGATRVTALDVDPVAAFVAYQTCMLNQLRPKILAGRLDALQRRSFVGTYEVALANVIPSRLRPDLPKLVQAVIPTGQVLLSGILVEQETDLLAEIAELGLRYRSRLEAEGWVALRMEKTAP